MEEMFADQNDINEDTRAQLDAISIALAELQAKRNEAPRRKNRIQIAGTNAGGKE